MEEEKKQESIVPLKIEEKNEETVAVKPNIEGMKKNLNILKKLVFWQILGVILIIYLVTTLFIFFSGDDNNFISGDLAKEKVQDYVNLVLGENAIGASLGEVREEKGLYAIDILIEGQSVTSYITKDGKIFFPGGVDLDKVLSMPLLPTTPIDTENTSVGEVLEDIIG